MQLTLLFWLRYKGTTRTICWIFRQIVTLWKYSISFCHDRPRHLGLFRDGRRCGWGRGETIRQFPWGQMWRCVVQWPWRRLSCRLEFRTDSSSGKDNILRRYYWRRIFRIVLFLCFRWWHSMCSGRWGWCPRYDSRSGWRVWVPSVNPSIGPTMILVPMQMPQVDLLYFSSCPTIFTSGSALPSLFRKPAPFAVVRLTFL